MAKPSTKPATSAKREELKAQKEKSAAQIIRDAKLENATALSALHNLLPYVGRDVDVNVLLEMSGSLYTLGTLGVRDDTSGNPMLTVTGGEWEYLAIDVTTIEDVSVGFLLDPARPSIFIKTNASTLS